LDSAALQLSGPTMSLTVHINNYTCSPNRLLVIITLRVLLLLLLALWLVSGVGWSTVLLDAVWRRRWPV